jgi:hypothetical protein
VINLSTGFNVETYQMGKQNGVGAGTGVNQAILDRIQKLEDNQMSIANQFYCDFTVKDYIDTYKTNVINTGHGIIPRQYKDTWFDPFDFDDNVDWDKSKNVAFTSNKIALDSPTTRYGEFYTLPITLPPYIGFKFNANVKIPVTENLEGQQELKTGALWFAKGVDNYGRLWLFRYDTYKCEEGPVLLTIYNRDMTIYKESTIAAASFFGTPSVYGAYKLSPMHNTASIVFSEENLCVIAFTSEVGRNGVYWESQVNDGNQCCYVKHYINFVNENGVCANKYNYVQTFSVHQWYVQYYSNQYHGLVQGFEPCRLFIQKNRVYYVSPQEARWFGYYNYDTNRMLRVILQPSTLRLNDPAVAVTPWAGISYYYEPYNAHYMTWSSRFGTKIFQKNGIMYHFITDYIGYNQGLPVGRMYLAEVKLDDNNPAFAINNQLTLNATITYPLYGFGGANGMHYSEKYNYLYIFSNAYNSNMLYITRYEVDWSTKTTTGITLKNPKIKSIQISGTTFWPGLVQWGAATDHRWHFNEKLKVHEDADKLCLLYGNRNPISLNQQINYMSIDFDMDVVQVETQIHTADATQPATMAVEFGLVTLDDKNVIMYTQGDKNNFTDATAEPASHLFTTVSSSISSKLTWYYATDTDVTWKGISLGNTITLPGPANDIRLKAVLESNGRYDSSPSISELYVESWDNGMQESRQSEFYSTQITEIQDEGKAVLTADQDLNDGFIDWYVSYDGGHSWVKVELDTEFYYAHVDAPDFRVKAVISVVDNAINLPIVRSFTVKSNHIVLHSDLEEIQINLMKTNFKIDTLARASRNGMFKMVIDVFNDISGIDAANSDYLFYPLDGAVGGNYIVTTPITIDSSIVNILIASSEILDTTEPNSRVNYFASLDNGVTYTQVYPDIKAQLTNTSTTTNKLIIKAVFYDDARLSAIGIAWD